MFEGSVSSGGGNNQAQFQTTSHSQGRNDNYIVQSSTKGRGLRDGSPTGAKGYIHQQTPFFQLENTDHKNHQYSGYSVKEFSLGKPQKFRSTYKKNQLFQKTEDQANPSSKDPSIPNKENLQPKLINSLNELKRIRNEFVKVIEQEISDKNKHNQVEYAALNDDITLLLNDDTRINNSFINESHQKPGTLTASVSPLSNTPSKSPTPSRFIPELGGSRGMPPRGGERSKSNQFVGLLPQHLHSSQPANTMTRKEDGLYMMTNSQLMTSLDRAEVAGFAPLTGQQRGYNTTPDRHSASPKGFNGNDSFLNKSQDFPKMLKRKASRPYTKVLIPFMIDKDRESEYIDPVLAGLPTSPSRNNPSQEWRIFDLFKVQRFVKKEFSNEYYEGLCLIRGQKRPVLIRRTTDQSAVMREIMMNLVFYENEVNFSAVSILKMRDFFNTNGHFHVIYDRPGDWLLHSGVIASGLSEQVCMSMAADLAKTIGLVHSLGIVHSKLCPESLYLAYDSGNTSSAGNPNGGIGYRLRVSDFEHAFFEGEHTDKIVPSNYSAPEVIFAAPGSQKTHDESHALGINFNGSPISGFGDDSFIRGTASQGRIQVDHRSDYWSVGCLLYFLGTGGSHLFPAKSRLRTGYLIEKLLSSGSNIMGVPSPGFTQTKPSFPEEMVYLYPGYADKLSKLTSEVRTELDSIAAETSFKLEELRNSKPALFRVISDCLKLNPEERYSFGLNRSFGSNPNVSLTQGLISPLKQEQSSTSRHLNGR